MEESGWHIYLTDGRISRKRSRVGRNDREELYRHGMVSSSPRDRDPNWKVTKRRAKNLHDNSFPSLSLCFSSLIYARRLSEECSAAFPEPENNAPRVDSSRWFRCFQSGGTIVATCEESLYASSPWISGTRFDLRKKSVKVQVWFIGRLVARY